MNEKETAAIYRLGRKKGLNDSLGVAFFTSIVLSVVSVFFDVPTYEAVPAVLTLMCVVLGINATLFDASPSN